MDELYAVYDPQNGDLETGTKEEMEELYESWKENLDDYGPEPGESLHLFKAVKTAEAVVDEDAAADGFRWIRWKESEGDEDEI